MLLSDQESKDLAYMAELIRLVGPYKEVPEVQDISGSRGYTYLVNNETVMKFSNGLGCALDLRSEARISTYLQGRLPVQVPPMEWKSALLNPHEGPIEFVTMPYIKMPTLFLASVGELIEEDDEKEIARQLGSIMGQLHMLPISEVSQLGIKGVNEYIQRELEWKNDEIKSQLAQMSGSFKNQLLSSVAESVFGQEAKYPSLCHLDLHKENVLVDLQTRRIGAILDFGSAMIVPASVDLDRTLEVGEMFAESVFEGYYAQTGREADRWHCERVTNSSYVKRCYRQIYQNEKMHA